MGLVVVDSRLMIDVVVTPSRTWVEEAMRANGEDPSEQGEGEALGCMKHDAYSQIISDQRDYLRCCNDASKRGDLTDFG